MSETKINANQTNITADDIGALSASNESTATVGQVLTKTATGAEWDDAQGGGISDVTVNGTSVVSGSVATITGMLKNNSNQTGGLAILGTDSGYSGHIVIGSNARFTNSWASGSVTIGRNANNSGAFNVVIGADSTSSAECTVLVGNNTNASSAAKYAVGIGPRANITGHGSILLTSAGGNGVTLSEQGVFAVALRKQIPGDFEDTPVYKMLDSDGTIPAARHASLPSADGTYVLKLVIANGVPTLSWVAE